VSRTADAIAPVQPMEVEAEAQMEPGMSEFARKMNGYSGDVGGVGENLRQMPVATSSSRAIE
jgi:hypothetical protein